ncbi:MAG: hypothetical protein GC162_10070 [Planctomycetes bacterium]|nr:hypothetical protein [Planctomycetota bacterium]
MNDKAVTPSAPKPRRWRRRVLPAIVILVVLPLVFVYFTLSARPGYWRVVDVTEAGHEHNAQQFEQGLSSETTRVRPAGARWELPLNEQQVNDWLAVRLPQWLVNQNVDPKLIGALHHAMMHTDPNTNTLEFAAQPAMITVGPLHPIVRLHVSIIRQPDEPLALKLTGVWLGRFPIALDTLAARVPGQFKIDEPLPLILPLKDGREVAVMDATFVDGGVMLTCETRRAMHKK